MRVAVIVLVCALSVFLAGCPNGLAQVCSPGLSTDPPDVADGHGTATRSDSAAFDAQATWSPGANAAVDVGALDLIIAKDQTGSAFDQLVSDGAFPFCVPLGARSDTSGVADLNEGNTFVSDAGHLGNVAVLSADADVLVGRFEVTVVSASGAATISFTNGAFRAHRL